MRDEAAFPTYSRFSCGPTPKLSRVAGFSATSAWTPGWAACTPP